jgi:signal transduction histidine kinase
LEHRAGQLQKLTLELSQAEDRERQRIAAILHEDLQQQIAGARFHLNLLRDWAKHDPQRQLLEEADEALKEAIQESRSLSQDLSPAVLHMNDLTGALEWLAHRVQVQHGLTVHLSARGDVVLQSEGLTTFLFRAAQEMLFNVVKHAQVNEATVRVRRLGRCVCLCVSDKGQGFNPQELKETTGLGLLGIRERVELLGGRMTIKSVVGKGSRFYIVVPDGPPFVTSLPAGE